jgi:hypothetical protein
MELRSLNAGSRNDGAPSKRQPWTEGLLVFFADRLLRRWTTLGFWVILLTQMTGNRLLFSNLSERHPGVTAGLSAAFDEAARVCLGRHHSSPQQMRLKDDSSDQLGTVVEWARADPRTENGWANKDDATQYGAYGLALAAIELTRGMVAVRRAETRTGSDYYLGFPGVVADDLEASLRIEVSGIDSGNETAIRGRLRQKLEQAAKGKSNLPAIATVVGFATLIVATADLKRNDVV